MKPAQLGKLDFRTQVTWVSWVLKPNEPSSMGFAAFAKTQLKPGFLIVLMNPAKLGYLSLRTQLKPRFNLCWTQLSIPGCLKVEAEFPILSLFPATKTYHLVSHELFLHLLLMLIHVISFFHFPFAFCIYIGLATLLPTWPFPVSCKIAKVKPLFKRHSEIDPQNYRPASILLLFQFSLWKFIGMIFHYQTEKFLRQRSLQVSIRFSKQLTSKKAFSLESLWLIYKKCLAPLTTKFY